MSLTLLQHLEGTAQAGAVEMLKIDIGSSIALANNFNNKVTA